MSETINAPDVLTEFADMLRAAMRTASMTEEQKRAFIDKLVAQMMSKSFEEDEGRREYAAMAAFGHLLETRQGRGKT